MMVYVIDEHIDYEGFQGKYIVINADDQSLPELLKTVLANNEFYKEYKVSDLKQKDKFHWSIPYRNCASLWLGITLIEVK